jgi:hypothetical protein
MKLSRSLLLVLSSILFIAFVAGVAYKVSTDLKEKKVGSEMLAYMLKPEQTTLNVGDKVRVPVYLTGDVVEDATAFDLKISYDKSKLRLDKAEVGTFYDKPLTVKWEPKQAWFALAMTPEDPQKPAHSDEPMVILEFTTLAKTNQTQVSTSDSTVYVADTGGFHPQAGRVTLSIQ